MYNNLLLYKALTIKVLVINNFLLTTKSPRTQRKNRYIKKRGWHTDDTDEMDENGFFILLRRINL